MALSGFRAFMAHPVWSFLYEQARPEMDAFREASRVLARNQLVGFGTHAQTELVKATKFPAICYASQQLLMLMGGQASVRDYKGKFETPHRSMINAIIRKYSETLVQNMDLSEYQGDNAYEVNDWFADHAIVLASIEN